MEDQRVKISGRDAWIEYREKHTPHYGIYADVEEIIHSRQSEFQKIEIMRTPQFGVMLVLDGFINTTEKDEFIYHEMMTHIPLYSHKEPKRTLVIGGGDGGILREIGKHGSVEEMVLVDIDPDIVDVSKEYLPSIAKGFSDSRSKVIYADGSIYVKEAPEDHFDVIIADTTDPVGPGEVLFTKEFYSQISRILRPGGVFVLQSGPGSIFMDGYDGVQPILKSVFQQVHPFLANIDTYGGLWTMTFCSHENHPIDHFQHDRYLNDKLALKYYNSDVHRGAFAIPNYLVSRLDKVI